MSRGPHRLPTLEAKLTRLEDGKLELRSPGVGLMREMPPAGSVVAPGESLGRLEVLGRFHEIVCPAGAGGLVVERRDAQLARPAVDFGAWILRLDPEAGGVGAGLGTADEAGVAEGAVVFKAPSSGRFYARPSPDKPAFVEAGTIVETGNTVAILEVMKTFNRIAYGGSGLPPRAKVVRVIPNDGDDLGRGDVILELEPA